MDQRTATLTAEKAAAPTHGREPAAIRPRVLVERAELGPGAAEQSAANELDARR